MALGIPELGHLVVMELRQQQTQAPSRVMSISFLVNNYPGDIDFSPAHADNYNNQFFHNDVDEDMEDVECDRSAIPEPTPKPIPDEHDNIESSKDSRPVVEVSVSLKSCWALLTRL